MRIWCEWWFEDRFNAALKLRLNVIRTLDIGIYIVDETASSGLKVCLINLNALKPYNR